ncbi:MAG TPA: hypothetical protein VFO79_07915, partial [Xanthomonadales bacterium]|nr:hypothetical protein [Xanthomonadales bacterium]
HDHVVAVRATPPRVMPGERAKIDALLAHADRPTTVEAPAAAISQAPEGDPLANLVAYSGDGWYLTAPSEEVLAAVRARDGLAAGAPVPVRVAMAFQQGEQVLYAKKTVYLGARAENPAVPIMAVDGQPAADQLVVPMERDIYVSVPVDDTTRVNWLTSCGSLFQDDVATAFLRVLPEDDHAGELAVVVRDANGGVAWRVWPIAAQR